jgi:hypothetical protein
VLYDSKDLVTHALCVGMTEAARRSRHAAIEEAAIDGVPVIVIDPKGDLTNLLLTFPNLRPDDLRRGLTRTKRGVPGSRRPSSAAARQTSGSTGWRNGAKTALASAPS